MTARFRKHPRQKSQHPGILATVEEQRRRVFQKVRNFRPRVPNFPGKGKVVDALKRFSGSSSKPKAKS